MQLPMVMSFLTISSFFFLISFMLSDNCASISQYFISGLLLKQLIPNKYFFPPISENENFVFLSDSIST